MTENARWKATLDIITVCKRMWQKGFVANHDGNVTARLDNEFLATPTAVSKVDISPEIILTLDQDGKKIAGPGKPFSEISLHLACYRSNPEIGAVVHAHSPYATARGVCGLPIAKSFIPEAVVSLGDVIPVVAYSTPGSEENIKGIVNALSVSNAFMLAGNGVIAVGSDVMQAYLRLELVEHLAHMDFIAKQLGTPLEIPAGDIARLLEKRNAAGLVPRSNVTTGFSYSTDDLRKIISEELRFFLEDLSPKSLP